MRVTVARIQREVCEIYGISLCDMLSNRRVVRFIEPRHVAIAVAANSTLHSLTVIGRLFHRDHSTIVHAVRKIDVDTHPVANGLVKRMGGVARVNRPRSWSDEKVAYALQLRKQGMTYAQVAGIINEKFGGNISRSAVQSRLVRELKIEGARR